MRAVLLMSLVLISVSCASPPRSVAQPASNRPVSECVAIAGPEQRASCIGDVARACMESPGGETTGGSVACFERERAQWQTLRESVVAELRGRESPTQLALLDTALAQHESWSRARCAYAASIYEGGSLARVVAAQCMRDAAAEHAIELIGRSDEL